MKILLIAALFSFSTFFAQNSLPEKPHLKLKEDNSVKNYTNAEGNSLYKKADFSPGLFALVVPFIFINPILVFEDKKVFWGLTKEISFSTLHYGRFSFEYSFLFRTFNKNHLRFSYNYDFMYQQGTTWLFFVLSTGAGYFTDTENKGAFAQSSMGFFCANSDIIHPHLP